MTTALTASQGRGNMTRRFATLVKGLILATAVTAATERHASADPLYSITDIGQGDYKALNDSGQVIGRRYFGVYSPTGITSIPRGILYSNGTETDLGPDFLPDGINNKGQIVGIAIASSGEKQIEVRDPDGATRMLGPYIGHPNSVLADYPAYTLGINSSGQVVAASDNETRLYAADGKSSSLFNFADPYGSAGTKLDWVAGLSDSGRVAGSAYVKGLDSGALVYTGSDGLEHPYAPSPMLGGAGAVAASHSGLILGYNFVFSPDTGLATAIKYPGDLADVGYQAHGINDSGLIVGLSYNSLTNGYGAFVLDGNNLVNLNDVIPLASGIHLDSAKAINDNGQILASGKYVDSNGPFPHNFLLTPVNTPEPSTIVIFAAGLLALHFGRKKTA
jgi:hypothetical protein